MKRKIIIFSAIVIALCILCIIKAPYLIWSIGGFEDERFFIFAIFALLSGVLYFSIGCCFLYGNVFTQSSSAIPPMLAAKFIDHYKKVEIKLKSSIKETTFCFVILFVTFGGLSLYLVGKFDEYVAYGDCLFTKCPPGGKVSSLYTKDGRTIVDNKHYYLDFTKHEDCMLSDSDIGIDEPYYNDKSCVIECPGGPYFCYIKKVKIDQKSKGESYEYNKYDNRVYYQYEDYRIDYLIAIYNSAGSYIDDYEDDFRFEYFPNKKKIDGKECSYFLYGDEIKYEYEFAEKLGKMVAEYLTDYISEMNKETESAIETYSSSSNANTSSRSLPDDGLLYEGIYTESGQGYCIEMGTYVTSTPDMSYKIKIYNDYILVGSTKHNYVRTEGGWRIYKGVGNFGSTPFYKVNPNTFAMSKYTIMPNQYSGGVNTLTFAMEKGEVVFNRNTSNSSGGYNNGMGNTNSNSTASQRSGRTKKECGLCDGKGTVISTKGVSFGMEKWCSECGERVPSNHHHETCPSCKGEGKW